MAIKKRVLAHLSDIRIISIAEDKSPLPNKITEAKDIVLSECSVPEMRPGWVLVKAKAFGPNPFEKPLRRNE